MMPLLACNVQRCRSFAVRKVHFGFPKQQLFTNLHMTHACCELKTRFIAPCYSICFCLDSTTVRPNKKCFMSSSAFNKPRLPSSNPSTQPHTFARRSLSTVLAKLAWIAKCKGINPPGSLVAERSSRSTERSSSNSPKSYAFAAVACKAAEDARHNEHHHKRGLRRWRDIFAANRAQHTRCRCSDFMFTMHWARGVSPVACESAFTQIAASFRGFWRSALTTLSPHFGPHLKARSSIST